MTTQVPQMLRGDARENRERILAAARALFAEQGLDVTMREVARRAQVGPATLYRRFPTRQDLVDAAFADAMHTCRTVVEVGCADPDPWRGFASVVERLTRLNAQNQGFVDALMSVTQELESFTGHRTDLLRRLADLIARAQEAGDLRRDVVIGDLVMVLLAGRALSTTRLPDRDAAAHRFAALTLEAFRASEENRPLPPGPRRGRRRTTA